MNTSHYDGSVMSQWPPHLHTLRGTQHREVIEKSTLGGSNLLDTPTECKL
jgi:hypothetical protein